MKSAADSKAWVPSFATWEQWINFYQQELSHPQDYEELFVRRVLMHIPLIDPDDVIPQYHFQDSLGKNRYIDFVIINENKGYRLAIELDGKWKLGTAQYRQDMWQRQNDLLKLFPDLYRYMNHQMFQAADEIVTEISRRLEQQASQFCQQQKAHEQQQAQLQHLQAQAQIGQVNNEALLKLQTQLDELTQKVNQHQQADSANDLPYDDDNPVWFPQSVTKQASPSANQSPMADTKLGFKMHWSYWIFVVLVLAVGLYYGFYAPASIEPTSQGYHDPSSSYATQEDVIDYDSIDPDNQDFKTLDQSAKELDPRPELVNDTNPSVTAADDMPPAAIDGLPNLPEPPKEQAATDAVLDSATSIPNIEPVYQKPSQPTTQSTDDISLPKAVQADEGGDIDIPQAVQ